ncbi:MAG: hypothetical protein UU98_C0003G0019 [Parcubacteria group bacterium GW2011_GWD2_42_14]|nr:MAG: hypothetical protein UU98_C0003G0019 [Parcubacteria group bacterium GW2011_GWD2_42_14]
MFPQEPKSLGGKGIPPPRPLSIGPSKSQRLEGNFSSISLCDSRKRNERNPTLSTKYGSLFIL